mgnify:CR=1 FL=1
MITLNNFFKQWVFSIGIATLALGFPARVAAENMNDTDNIYNELPFQMNAVQLPVLKLSTKPSRRLPRKVAER